jgi:hypothetical protein
MVGDGSVRPRQLCQAPPAGRGNRWLYVPLPARGSRQDRGAEAIWRAGKTGAGDRCERTAGVSQSARPPIRPTATFARRSGFREGSSPQAGWQEWSAGPPGIPSTAAGPHSRAQRCKDPLKAVQTEKRKPRRRQRGSPLRSLPHFARQRLVLGSAIVLR